MQNELPTLNTMSTERTNKCIEHIWVHWSISMLCHPHFIIACIPQSSQSSHHFCDFCNCVWKQIA